MNPNPPSIFFPPNNLILFPHLSWCMYVSLTSSPSLVAIAWVASPFNLLGIVQCDGNWVVYE